MSFVCTLCFWTWLIESRLKKKAPQTCVESDLSNVRASNSFGLFVWSFLWDHIRAAARQNQQNNLCAQRRLRSACTSAQSDQSLRCPHEEELGPWLPTQRQWRLWSDCAAAQAELSLIWAHMILLGFVVVRVRNIVWFRRELISDISVWTGSNSEVRPDAATLLIKYEGQVAFRFDFIGSR